MYQHNFYIFTGGPGAGKTTVLNELAGRGYCRVEEDARRIIQEQLDKDGTALPWKDKAQYTQLMLTAAVASYRAAGSFLDSPVFFDRSLVDSYAYATLEDIRLSDADLMIADQIRYNSKVFFFPPWPEIYQNDAARKQTFDEAVLTSKILRTVYEDHGYDLVDVPKADVVQRADFILQHI
ncbi:putative ATPase [Sphingobacterium allocomposti]|uniref:Putative ATPase n=1 Tax=Sphingobacterium allocomposti TaxID=415956 RepID=A0A5S5DR77_9SPHI|nr:AAA family ATPase [Sphingobacterium composti Yoo et al. 2007 non Ten et al. 2007]TYP97149.1 putative ATPase [Sphingobacterium composti Yoo et al. 2007 non Ten et al. 2007]